MKYSYLTYFIAEKKILKVFFVFLVFLYPLSNLEAQWKQTDFLIGGHCLPVLSVSQYSDADMDSYKNVTNDLAIFNLIKGCGIDVITYPHFASNPEEFGTRHMDYYLSLAQQSSLKLLITDSQSMIQGGWDQPTPINSFNLSTATSVINHYKGLTTRDGLFGYNLKDEPSPSTINPSHLTTIQQWINYIKVNDNTKLAYINLLPIYGFSDKASYEAYLDEYLNNSNSSYRPDAIAYDHYLGYSLGKDYFYNLDIMRKKAGKRPFYENIDVYRKGNNYIEPDESYVNFAANCAVAYGAKGIIYYTITTFDYAPQSGLVHGYNEFYPSLSDILNK